MTATRQSPPVECSGHCDRCGMLSAANHSAADSNYMGWRLVWRSALVFLLPLLGAAMGASWLNSTPVEQLAGAVLGFSVALAIAIAVTRQVNL